MQKLLVLLAPGVGLVACVADSSNRLDELYGEVERVNWIAFDPSASQLQSSSLPERSETKEIFFPSGEYCGIHSFRVDEMNFIGGLAFPCCEADLYAPDIGIKCRVCVCQPGSSVGNGRGIHALANGNQLLWLAGNGCGDSPISSRRTNQCTAIRAPDRSLNKNVLEGKAPRFPKGFEITRKVQ